MRRNPAAGDYFELRRYYLALPEEKIRESVELMVGMITKWHPWQAKEGCRQKAQERRSRSLWQ
ncbi:MAG: hypothetical protein PUB10_02140 [Clostridiales bacterium]|nr:hypothetical protein [Clostridiales bacterium]